MTSVRKRLRDAAVGVVRALDLPGIRPEAVYPRLVRDELKTVKPCVCLFYTRQTAPGEAFTTEHDTFAPELAVVLIDRSPPNWPDEGDRYEEWEQALLGAFLSQQWAGDIVPECWYTEVLEGPFLDPAESKMYQHQPVGFTIRCHCVVGRAV